LSITSKKDTKAVTGAVPF